jgi:protein-tyrosine-phosphatase
LRFALAGLMSHSSPDEKIRVNSVLFVCGMNAIRSPMAEALTKKHFGQGIFVQSAGVLAGNMDGFMQQVMNEIGVDIGGHKPITLEQLEDDFFDIIVTLSPEAHHRSLDWASERAVAVEYWPTMDPSTVAGSRQQVVDAYRATRDSLDKRIQNRFESTDSKCL